MIELSTFGLEVVAVRNCIEFVIELRCNLSIMEVPINRQQIVSGGNMSVVNVVSILESKISKNHLGIWYHAVREAYAAGIWKLGFVKVTNKIYNWLTNIFSGAANIKEVETWMWRKYPGARKNRIYICMYIDGIG